ncbi:MAG TPA: DUF6596 domain-containing protein [Streptosporangiaceae bacterium]|nr:DUF6596 domain-containing protein [Streptosporangiaceae bacterium]
MAKFMLLQNYEAGAGCDMPMTEWALEDVKSHIAFQEALNAELAANGEVAGMLALMLLTDARRPARTGPGGELIPLEEQDRALWDRALIAEGMALITGALAKGVAGEYLVQALIAAAHDGADSVEDTDWAQILSLYGLLERMTGNPMVASTGPSRWPWSTARPQA